ncbi:MAG: GTPase/DUF3482 domain-containing protein [Gammaproteobacteria bacterium]
MSDVCFAVVGHPNKGKSSIVSTLSRNDAIAISARSGTTSKSDHYKVQIADASYTLIDTPGFQRPRQLLHQIKSNAADASQRAEAVNSFINDPSSKTDYPDEVELLTPIMAGAAIIYVVDGSHPYGPEYEAEMEILRWCGQPRLAIVNPIHNDHYIDEWRAALDQFFSLVQVFNPFQATVDQQSQLLESFRVIAPDWGVKLSHIASAMATERTQWRQLTATDIANYLIDVCSYKVEQKLPDTEQVDAIQQVLKTRYESYVIKQERKLFQQMLMTYKHVHSALQFDDLDLPPDLFDIAQWYLWGLNKKQLIMSMTAGGIIAGGGIDLAVGGASFMAGSLLGAVGGLVSGVASTMGLSKFKINGIPMTGKQLNYGPIKDPNYPYVLINRALHLYKQIVAKNHADRSDVNINSNITTWELTLNKLSDTMRKQLHKKCTQLSQQRYVPSEELSAVLDALLKTNNK